MELQVKIEGQTLVIDDENFSKLAEAILKYAKDKRLPPKQPELGANK